MFDFITLIDGYKLDHRRQYPTGTQRVYSNFTPRMSRIRGQAEVVPFGLQYFLAAYLIDSAHETFFSRSRARVMRDYVGRVAGYLGAPGIVIGADHIGALHELGYIPLRFCAVPEGMPTPLRMPVLTVENTEPEFYWLTNYIETLLSNVLWHPMTSATTAYRYRKLLDRYAEQTDGDKDFVPWQGHDFSFRGLSAPEAAALSGAGHLLSFSGTDTIPSIELLEKYYGAGTGVAGSVPATEHSVMCAGGATSEQETFERLLDLYPTGVLSVVSDTWDLWHVITKTLPALKDKIMARPGKLVIRPDSGNPENILCGDPKAAEGSPAQKGVIQLLWEIFGGTTNSAGYKVLDPHIGAIYGDSITEERAEKICWCLKANRFASTNVVLGIGSYTYQYVTRDTYGFAMKATWAKINDQEHQLYKDPKTDNGVKKSARGRIALLRDDQGGIRMEDGLTLEQEQALAGVNLLQPVWEDGVFLRQQSVNEIRGRLHGRKVTS